VIESLALCRGAAVGCNPRYVPCELVELEA
jgi:hypothetical protein